MKWRNRYAHIWPAAICTLANILLGVLTATPGPAGGLDQHRSAAAQDPFATLRQGYASGSAGIAASAYSHDAIYVEQRPGNAQIVRIGRSNIRRGFANVFRSLGLGPRYIADLNFRIAADGRSGLYRLCVPGRPAGFGRFKVRIVGGRFTSDISSPATRADFQAYPAPLRFVPDAYGSCGLPGS